jgi:hypothetical protein
MATAFTNTGQGRSFFESLYSSVKATPERPLFYPCFFPGWFAPSLIFDFPGK